jgi:hypothetical protein
MRSLYRVDKVEKWLGKLPQRDHESLCAARQSHRVLPACVCPHLRGWLRGLAPHANDRFGAVRSKPRMSLVSR